MTSLAETTTASPSAASLRHIVIALLSMPIHLYRYLLSPLLPPACRYWPSCSAYALEALAVHGPVAGSWLVVRRIVRCHPWGGWGWDPVPPAGGPCRCSTGDSFDLRADDLPANDLLADSAHSTRKALPDTDRVA